AARLCAGASILPEPVETIGAQFGIPHRVHDVAVAQEVLQRASIDTVIRQFEPAGVAEHVRMNREGQFGQLSSPADHFEEPGPCYRPTAFRIEYEATLRVLPPQLAQCPDFLAGERCVLSTPFLARLTWMRPLSSSSPSRSSFLNDSASATPM